MALHRKQRGFADSAPQYVRIPTSGGRAVGYSLHDANLHAQRVYAKRYAAPGDRSRKISSLQLRACFVLCVLLYFGAIYFADDIASLGRVVGSEQNSQSFFVHSLRPRGRGNMRVGRAVDAKKAEATAVPVLTNATPDEVDQQQQDDPTTEMPGVETHSRGAETATAESEEAQATEPIEQPGTEMKTLHQDEQQPQDGAPGDAVHPDDQGEDIPADPAKNDTPVDPVAATIDEKPGVAAIQIGEPKDLHHEAQKRGQEDSTITLAPAIHPAKGQPQPTAALRHPQKEGDGDAVPAASPARVEQRIRGNVDSTQEIPKRQADRSWQPSETVDGQQGEQQPAETPSQAKESVNEHISDI